MKKQTSLVQPRLQDKTVIVVGASKGIGRSIAEVFAEQGAKVLLVSRDISKLKEVVFSLKGVLPKRRL